MAVKAEQLAKKFLKRGWDKLTARERIDLLMDEGSFEELGMLVQHRSRNFG